MSKLTKYASEADFMNVSIEIDGKVYKFNLDIQLKIEETNLTTSIKEQPRSYAFLCMLRNKVKVEFKRKSKTLDRKKAELYNKATEGKDKTKVTDIRAKVAVHPEVKKLEDELEHFDELRHVLDICVDSFEQRKDLIQTLSSNLRNEK